MLIDLSEAEFAAWQRKVDTLHARAVKRGWTGRLTLTGRRVVVRNSGSPRRFPQYPDGAELVRVEAELAGEAPCYGGWTLVAALDEMRASDETSAWVVRCAPGVDAGVVDRSVLRAGWCDHCATSRARRRLYAVRHRETGEVRQVGSTCLRDFTGWSTAPVFLGEAEVVEQLGGLGGGPDAFTPDYVVGVASAAVAAQGWRSRSSAAALGGGATADLVESFLVCTGEPGRVARELLEPHLAAGLDGAGEIRRSIAAAAAGRTDDGYLANLTAALQAESVTLGQVGLLASAPDARRRLTVDEADAEQDDRVEPVWLGAVGDKVEIEGTIRFAVTVDGYTYGTTQRLIVAEAGTTLAKMYTAAAWSYEVKTGNRVRLTGTVKAHDTYRGQQQTVLTRAKRVAS